MSARAHLEWAPDAERSRVGTTWCLWLHHVDGDTVKLAEIYRLGVDILQRDSRTWWKASVPGAPRPNAIGFADLDRAVDWAERVGLGNVGLGAAEYRVHRMMRNERREAAA